VYSMIKEDINDIYYQQYYANDGQRFIAWYLRNIHMRDVIQAKDDITDGADDKQIDAIVVDDEKQTVFIIQGKYISTGSIDAEPLREVLSSWMQLRDLISLQNMGNDKLKRKLMEVANALEDDYEVEFELVTTGKLTEAANNDLATFQQSLVELSENESFNASIFVIDADELKNRYELALEKDNPTINHKIDLTNCPVLEANISGNKAVIAAIPLKECIRFPGIKDGTLFKKNVRQSLGLSNRVNKGIKSTIYSDQHKEFFFYHNGITAICNNIKLENSKLILNGFNVVNGCQSLTTMLSCSEQVKKIDETYVLFRFYEIPQRERADKISINTNSQSAVKPRDLRSNDKKVLNMKRAYELKYANGYFITKRGEQPPASKDKKHVVDLVNLGKYLISWHSQRPNIAYSETKIFDKYYDQLFKKDYPSENILALERWMQTVWDKWGKENPLSLNESLLAMRAYAPYHHLYAISVCFGVSNSMPVESVPNPSVALKSAEDNHLLTQIVDLAGKALNIALETAATEPQPANRVFSPQNWIKTKSCLAGIRAAVNTTIQMLPMVDASVSERFKQGLKLQREDFDARWSAD
jgi:hypothetical protein